jgi:hypothetical protein
MGRLERFEEIEGWKKGGWGHQVSATRDQVTRD